MFNNDKLIDWATGEIDEAYIAGTAPRRAAARYDAAATALDVQAITEQLRAMAQALSSKRRRELGITEATVPCVAFGRPVEGLRHSEF